VTHRSSLQHNREACIFPYHTRPDHNACYHSHLRSVARWACQSVRQVVYIELLLCTELD